jgi:hypothetical protein
VLKVLSAAPDVLHLIISNGAYDVLDERISSRLVSTFITHVLGTGILRIGWVNAMRLG